MAQFPDEAESERIISGMKWMGILSSEKASIVTGNLLDTLCAQLEKLMSFQPGERDLVMLQHKFVVEWADGKTVCYSESLCGRYNTDSMFVGDFHVYIGAARRSGALFRYGSVSWCDLWDRHSITDR